LWPGLEVSDRNGDVRSLLLEPSDLIYDHAMPEMHPSARHQSGEHAEGVGSLYASNHHVEISVREHYASSMEHTGIRQRGGIDSIEPEPIDDAGVVGGLV
jgi:hypothetical protein